MSKSRNTAKRNDSAMSHVARAGKRIIMSEQNRRARKQESQLLKRMWNEELLTG